MGGGGGGGESMLAPPFSYSDIAGAGLAKFLDNITPEEAASLVRQKFGKNNGCMVIHSFFVFILYL